MHNIKNKRKLSNLKSTIFNTKRAMTILIMFLVGVIVVPLVLHFWIASNYKSKKFTDIQDVPEERVAIVFGAGLWDGKPGAVLGERVDVAVELYNEGKIEKIIMSGDNRFEDYDEPAAMIEMAIEKGVPEVVLQADFAGRRTFDTCYRAKHIFKLDSAVLITQGFHMDRALYLCNSLGVDSVGAIADMPSQEASFLNNIRDYFALVKSVWEVNINKPNDVVLGEKIGI